MDEQPIPETPKEQLFIFRGGPLNGQSLSLPPNLTQYHYPVIAKPPVMYGVTSDEPTRYGTVIYIRRGDEFVLKKVG